MQLTFEEDGLQSSELVFGQMSNLQKSAGHKVKFHCHTDLMTQLPQVCQYRLPVSRVVFECVFTPDEIKGEV